MGELPRDIPFDQWVEVIFGRSEAGAGSGAPAGDDWWNEERNPALAIAHLTRLFRDPDVLLKRYSHQSINEGLLYLVRQEASSHALALISPQVPWDDRKRALLAIGALYERLFARVCTNYLGHLGRGPELPDPLNDACYMWWDIFPHHGRHGGEILQETMPLGEKLSERRPPRRMRRVNRAEVETRLVEEQLRSVDDVMLYLMERTLRLESEPCREGALHGLGHWRLSYPDRIKAIIDRWLAERPAMSSELYTYAWTVRSHPII